MAYYRLIANKQGSFRRQKMGGVDFLVIPLVMLTDDVHTGTNDNEPIAVRYTGEVLGKRPSIWNGKPVVLDHPDGDTAEDPVFLESNQIGLILNSYYGVIENGSDALCGEAWVGEERLKVLNEAIYKKIVAGEAVEVSTGVSMDADGKAGVWNNRPFDTTATDIRADHLAFLTKGKGACSCKKGCGANKNQAPLRLTMQNAMSYNRISNAIDSALRTSLKPGYGSVDDVYDDYFIYHIYDAGANTRKMFQQKYKMDGDAAVISDDVPTPVQVVTEYRTAKGGAFVGNAAPHSDEEREAPTMAKATKAQVDELIVLNKDIEHGWVEEDREVLMAMAGEKVANQIEVAKTSVKNAETIKNTAPPVVEKKVTPEEKVAEDAWTKLLDAAPARVKASIQNAEAVSARLEQLERKEKKGLVDIIVTNKANKFKPEWLYTQEVEFLEGLAELAKSTGTPVQNRNPNALNTHGMFHDNPNGGYGQFGSGGFDGLSVHNSGEPDDEPMPERPVVAKSKSA